VHRKRSCEGSTASGANRVTGRHAALIWLQPAVYTGAVASPQWAVRTEGKVRALRVRPIK